ncbi:hypothetical protein [Flavobacterium enshiense]|uniref:hypothetical protein n=1 Tax=Flavobacterium enshiense TaxID=1341165 RepID=UPI00345C9AC7
MRLYYTTDNLQRVEPSLFRFDKNGIILKDPREWINLSHLFKINPVAFWDLIENLQEQELSKHQREDLNDVVEEFIKNNLD